MVETVELPSERSSTTMLDKSVHYNLSKVSYRAMESLELSLGPGQLP